MIKKGIDQCAGRISISRMHNHSGRLVNDDDGGVLMTGWSGEEVPVGEKEDSGAGRLPEIHVPGFKMSTGFGRSLIEKDMMFLESNFLHENGRD